MDREDLRLGRAQPGDRPPADGPLRLVQDLVNTVDRENAVELFDDAGGLAGWLAARGLPGAGDPIGARELRRALELREALRALLLHNNGGPDDPGARAVLDAAARRGGLRPVFAAGGPHLEPAAHGVDAALGQVVAVAFAAMLDGSWPRLKACPRDVCRWAFYDRSSANRSTWCSMQVCGNRVKAGAYYRRRRRG